LSACNKEGNGKGGKSDGNGKKEGDGDGSKSNGNGDKEGVGAKPMSVKIHSQDHELIPVPYNTMEKKSVSWRDILCPRHSSPAFHSSILDPLRIQATAE
jgi:hypothetical protein